MKLNELFELVDGLVGDLATFQGLQFNLPHGIMVVDTVSDYAYVLDNGEVDHLSGFVVDFAPLDELQSPATYFAPDTEALKYIISEFILE